MGRERKFYPVEVLEILKKRPATREELGEKIGCNARTASRLVAKLVAEGNDIGWNGDGYFLLDPEDLAVDTAIKWTTTLTNFLLRIGMHAHAHKKIARQLKGRLPEELTAPERQALKRELLLLTRVIDAVELDEELGS